jgi:ribonuclease BN (tRNA processing enzyme)
MPVKLTVVGSSPAWPNPGGAQSGYLVEGADGGRLLLDCGAGVLAKLRELEDWPRVDAVAITHWHLDHWGDIVPWVWAMLVGPAAAQPAPQLWVPPDGRTLLAEIGARLGKPGMFEDAFELREYGDEAFEAAGLRVEALRVLHYDLVAYGFRVSDDGTVLAYSGDSGPSEGLVELARDADLFLCEATLQEPNPEGGTRGHLAADEAEEYFHAAGAKRLLLTHRPAERPLEDRFELAYDGMRLEL